jgi:hypothetical protein
MAQGDILGIIENRAQSYLINGDFAIDQRFAYGNIVGASKYGPDRWFFAGGTSCQVVSEVGQDFLYSLRTVATAAGNTHLQRIESRFIRRLKNKEVTFSILMRLESGALGGLPMLRISYANVKDTYGATTLVADHQLESAAPMDGTYRLFKKTFTVTDQMAENGFFVQFGDFSSGTNVIRYAQAMLNKGSHAAKFQLATGSSLLEKRLCMRYFETNYDDGTALGTAANNGMFAVNNQSAGVNSPIANFKYSEHKRAIPTITAYSMSTGSSGVFRDILSATDKTANAIHIGLTGANIQVTSVNAGSVAYGYLGINSEL